MAGTGGRADLLPERSSDLAGGADTGAVAEDSTAESAVLKLVQTIFAEVVSRAVQEEVFEQEVMSAGAHTGGEFTVPGVRRQGRVRHRQLRCFLVTLLLLLVHTVCVPLVVLKWRRCSGSGAGISPSLVFSLATPGSGRGLGGPSEPA